MTKTPIPNTLEDDFSSTGHQNHILFAGTTVLQTKSTGERHVRAVVLRTGPRQCSAYSILRNRACACAILYRSQAS